MAEPADQKTPPTGIEAGAWPTDAIPILPMRNLVLFPHALTPVTIGRKRSIEALKKSSSLQGHVVGFLLQRKAQDDDPQPHDLFQTGTLARVVKEVRLESESGTDVQHIVCQGLQRFHVRQWLPDAGFLAAQIERLEEGPLTPSAEAAGLQLRARAAELLELLPGVPAELSHAVQSTRSLLQLGDVIAGLLDVELQEKQNLLEMRDAQERLMHILSLVQRRIEVLRLTQEIGARTREHLEDRERKFLLREQLNTIRKELGEDESSASRDLSRLEAAINAAEMPEEVARQAHDELHRLAQLPESSSEHAMLRTWLQWLCDLPWTLKPSAEPAEEQGSAANTASRLQRAQAVLEEDHHGLQKVKRTIIEHLAVRALNPQGRAPILCFVGPPGVGKTSLGQSIARAIQRPFARVSLGGVHDEAEIRGHRRTYIGAMPGAIISAIKRCGARDGVLMLDELDKVSYSAHGDPTSALLEVLDPAQNSSFRDNYLGVPFDLSQVLFIGTANVIENISGPLRDRLEVIELPGYTLQEKFEIARRYLLPRQRQTCGLQEHLGCDISEPALHELISAYTREAGVRQLEREIGRLMRHCALKVARGETLQPQLQPQDLEPILGPARHEAEPPLRRSLTGVATGLAWTPVGGDILFIEATRVVGTGRLILTGQLGEVMRESAQAALTLIKAQASSLGIPSSAFEAVDVHVHVPAGAIPKDGPSAGVALVVAMASLFSGRPVRHDCAMTGEISLRGLVFPVGGVREKVLAALRAGLKRVLLPQRNRKDLLEVPESARAQLQFVWLQTVDEALDAALEPGSGLRAQRNASALENATQPELGL